MGSEIVQKLTYLIEANDNSQRTFENFKHRLIKNKMLIKNLSSDEKAMWKEGALQGLESPKAIANSEKILENKRHRLALGKLELNQQQRIVKQTQRFRMEYLGIMFLGMQMQRVFTRFLKTMYTTYTSIFEETTELESQVNKVASAWQFFQFRLMEALSHSELFKNLINIVTSVLDKFSQLDENIRTGFVVAIGLAASAGAALFLTGQLTLGITSIDKAMGNLSTSAMIVASALVTIAALSWKAFLETPDAWEALKNTWKEVSKTILPEMKDTLNDFIELLGGDGINSWQDFAWNASWTGSVIIRTFTSVLSVIRMVINAISEIFSALKLVAAIMISPIEFLNTGTANESLRVASLNLDRIKRDIDDIGDAWKNFASSESELGALLTGGVSGFKQNYELQKNLELMKENWSAEDIIFAKLQAETQAHYDNAMAIREESDAYNNLTNVRSQLVNVYDVPP